MRTATRAATVFAAVALGVVCLPARLSGQELSAEAKDKAAAEARTKRNALTFDNNATTIVFYDRSGKRTGTLGGNQRSPASPCSSSRAKLCSADSLCETDVQSGSLGCTCFADTSSGDGDQSKR